MEHILIVDDEPSLVAVLSPVLEAAGYIVSIASQGRNVIQLINDTRPDLVLLDLGLPDMDGKDLIPEIRNRSAVPIIVVSARHQEAEKVTALDEGADDYVDKPFEIGELTARIRAAVRRRGSLHQRPRIFESGALSVNLESHTVALGDDRIHLSRKEFALLEALTLSAGQVVTHRRLLLAGWGSDTTDAQYLRVYIGYLRAKLEADPSSPRYILTEPGLGYRMAALDPMRQE